NCLTRATRRPTRRTSTTGSTRRPTPMNRPSPERPNDKAALPHDSPARLHDKAWPRRVPHDIPSLETTLWENLEITARRLPDKTALVFFGRQISYAELKAQVDRLAGWLQHDAGLAH